MAACAITACTALPGMEASCVKDLIAERAPFILWPLQHAQVVTHLGDELCCRNSEPESYAGSNLPKFLGAWLTFGEQGGPVHYVSLLQALVVSDFVKVVGKLFLAVAGYVLWRELLVGREFSIVGCKVHAKVRGDVVGVEREILQKLVALVS